MDRVVRLLLIGLVAAGMVLTGVSLAAGHSGGAKPGRGCGDGNHTHYKQDDCEKPPHGGDHHSGQHGDHGLGKGHSHGQGGTQALGHSGNDD